MAPEAAEWTGIDLVGTQRKTNDNAPPAASSSMRGYTGSLKRVVTKARLYPAEKINRVTSIGSTFVKDLI